MDNCGERARELFDRLVKELDSEEEEEEEDERYTPDELSGWFDKQVGRKNLNVTKQTIVETLVVWMQWRKYSCSVCISKMRNLCIG